MSRKQSGRHSLRPRLEAVQDELETARTQICDGPTVKQLNTGELIRIEETLAIAAETAKEAISLRRKLRADQDDADRDDGLS